MELQESNDQTNESSTGENIDKPEIPASIHQQHPVQLYDQPVVHVDDQFPTDEAELVVLKKDLPKKEKQFQC